MTPAGRSMAIGDLAALLAAGLSVAAAAIHFAVIGEHFAEYPPYGVLFALLAWFQVGWAFAYLARRDSRLAALAIVVNAGVIVVWATSRTTGLPIGPEPWTPEAAGPLDALATAFEVALIAALGLGFLPVGAAAKSRLPLAPAIAYLGAAFLAVAILTTAGFASVGSGSHADAGHGTEDPQGHAHDPFASPSAGPSVTHPEEETHGPSASPSQGTSDQTAIVPPGDGSIRFGSLLDVSGGIPQPTHHFHVGETAVWIADLREPPRATTLRFVIIQIDAGGDEVEHWDQELPVADPTARIIVGMAELSAYARGGPGQYAMRYLRGNELLAEGTFELEP